MFDFSFDYATRTVALGAGALGIVSGALGSFAVLRRQSLVGDAVSHAALPGVALAFLLTRTKAPLVLILGAAVAGWLAVLLAGSVVRTTRIKEDSALGLALSAFFGFGLVLLTVVQGTKDAGQAGLHLFLFGQAAALLPEDVMTTTVLGGIALALLALFWKEFKLLSFDPDFASCLGLPVRALDSLLTTLLVVAIVVGLQMVGVVLMSAMIVAPAAAARQWTDRLGVLVCLASFFGAVAGVAGVLLSSWMSLPTGSAAGRMTLPTGPTIVLAVSTIVLFSLLAAPHRGLLHRGVRRWQQRRQFRLETVLLDLYELAQQHPDREHGHPVAVLQAMRLGQLDVARNLARLRERGWARESEPGIWLLTSGGRVMAEHLREGHG